MRMNILGSFSFFIYCCCTTVHATELMACSPQPVSLDSVQQFSDTPLAEREGPRVKTSGKVPHVQVGVQYNKVIHDALLRLAFALPELEERPTVVSINGIGMWLADSATVAHPKAIVSGREFAHIHDDGSLHAPLPIDRAIELEKKGWGERHPWADRNAGWGGLVMLYSANTEDELKTLIQLITESYNHVTGRGVATPTC